MGFDMSNPGLGLGLGLGLKDENCMKMKQNRQRQKKKEIEDPCNNKASYPSLTLGPPHDDQQQITKDESDEYNNYYSPSAVSNSFSNCSSIKREREELELELEVDKIPSRLVDVDEINENGNPKKKLRLTKQQSAVLEDSFKEHSTLSPKQKQELAKKLNLRARQVEVWFQNRRARTKLKQTEVDCELLKKCCESLTEENKRLQKELQELKSMPGHFYMQVPVASLTICPSCDTICGGNGGAINSASSPTTPLLISPNPNHQFYKNSSNYTFTQSPAAC